VKAGKRAGKFEDKTEGREECRILTECKEKRKKYREDGETSTIYQ
jgi:hypothetical protein